MEQKRKRIAVLGSTGSIGRSTLEVAASFPERLQVVGLTAHRNLDLLQAQMERFRPSVVVYTGGDGTTLSRNPANGAIRVLYGEEGLEELVAGRDVDLVVSALVGFAGLRPTLKAIEAGKDVALANKETLVVGGELIMRSVRNRGVRLLPVDSEHSAVLQCLQGEELSTVERIILTASGGPFLHADPGILPSVTSSMALRHPTWSMGRKITIDSATLMNKGLEVIEAHWLFGLPAERIKVVVHPQSIIHSLVEFADGTMKAQLGVADMKLPIQYALLYPDRPAGRFRKLDLAALRSMTFLNPDTDTFRCLALAYRALALGGTAPAVLNAANEVAVDLFLDDRIRFTAIPSLIEEALEAHTPRSETSLDDLIRIDRETREHVLAAVSALSS
jgi:1-deoxy-D-xylulose-5-phosphate reductoisomerase